jgi:hypothetical protein
MVFFLHCRKNFALLDAFPAQQGAAWVLQLLNDLTDSGFAHSEGDEFP